MEQNATHPGYTEIQCEPCGGTGIHSGIDWEGVFYSGDCGRCNKTGKRQIENIWCVDCKHAGRGRVAMTYRGVVHSTMPVCVSTPDDAFPGGVAVRDEVMSVPFDIWRCEHGHEYTDGY